MNKIKLLTTAAITAMLSYNVAIANTNLDNMPEEEIARTIASILKKNPKIAYDAVVEYGKMKKNNEKYEDKELTQLEQKLAAVLKDNPALIVGALQIYEQQKQQEELLKRAESYKAYVEDINSDEIYAGNPNGKYILAEFFDFSCGYCKQMAPHIKSIIDKNPDLKVVFKPVAFLSKNSEIAARASIAASKQGKFLDMYLAIMKEIRPNEKGIEKIADDLGLDMEKYKRDYSSNETNNLIKKIRKTADNIKMQSVPTLILNGMPLYAVEEMQIQHAIDVLKGEQ